MDNTMMLISPGFVVVYILTMVFGFLDGFHNSANIVATVISTRVMRPRQALSMAALAEFVGPFLFGSAVAQTIGLDLVDQSVVSVPVILAALLSAIFWKLITWRLSVPSSSSHSLFGGLIGSIIIAVGITALKREGVQTIIVALLLSPLLGVIGGYIVMAVILFLTRRATPRINLLFKRGQLLTSTGLALTHGSNNAQKLMGILVLGLIGTGMSSTASNSTWISLSAASAIAIGTLSGGMRIIKTVAGKFYNIRPVHGFTAQATTATIVFAATLVGGPVSTTQIVSSSIVGVGAAERLNQVRWGVFTDIAAAWLITLPATSLLAAALYLPMKILFDLLT